jgi:hypothetical protein
MERPIFTQRHPAHQGHGRLVLADFVGAAQCGCDGLPVQRVHLFASTDFVTVPRLPSA